MTSTNIGDYSSLVISDFDSSLKYYISNHEELYKNVQLEISDWAKETQNDIELESIKHFASEKTFLDKIRGMKSNAFFADIVNIENKYNIIDSVKEKFDMQKYLNSYSADIKTLNENKKEKITLYQDSYFQALLNTLTQNFNSRKAEFEQNLIDEKRKQFLKELYERIENFKKLEQAVQPFIDDLGHGYLWDMSNTPFRNLGFDILKKYSELLKKDKAIQEFANMLGKQSASSKEVEKQLIEETIIKNEYHPQPAQSGNIVGFEYSNEISHVLPSEIGLLNNPELKDLFYLKFTEKQLLSYRYAMDMATTHSETLQKEKSKDLTGPIIICVDTSGSMLGIPEQTAKTATFAITKEAIKQHRKCFLISFSTRIETLDLSDFKKNNPLDLLVNFLNKTFNGGTDATPALSECLRQLKTKDYKNADVLIISDFVMSSLPQNIKVSIKSEQENGTYFYSLVIGESANDNAIECFDESIIYNPYSEISRQEFYKIIRQIAIKKRVTKKIE